MGAAAAPDRFLRAALAYAKAGWRVFPLAPRAKVPLIAKDRGGRGVLDATTDEAQIRAWWAAEPDANIGAALGAMAGPLAGRALIAIDVDVRGGKPGREELFALEQRLGALPATRTVATGTGGSHYYFFVPVGAELVSQLASAIDVKGAGGYVLLPPSVHPDTGVAYTWDGLQGWFAALVDLPAAWLAALARKQTPAAAEGRAEPEANAHLPAILEGCAWLRHTQADAATLAEPEWYAMLGIVGRCRDGARAAHAFSKPHPHYKRADTAKKLRHALQDAGPVTCARVAAELGGADRYCGTCPAWGTITSPVVLGARRAGAGADDPIAGGGGTEDWRRELLLNQRERPYPNVHNAALVLRQHASWRGCLAWDEFREKVMVRDGAPDGIPAGDLEERRLYGALVSLQRLLTPTLPEYVVRAAVELVAREQGVHPLRVWLEGLRWDERPRLREAFFARYFGARAAVEHRFRDDQALYWDEAAVAFFISAVARVFRPGAKVDHLFVLEGAAGASKTRALEVLAGGSEYLLRQLPPRLDWPITADQLTGAWWVEVADLGQHLRLAAARKFLTRNIDLQRERNGHWSRVARQAVFCATTSAERYLLDERGLRHLLPVRVGAIDLDALARDREQLYAEAVALYRAGVPWWPKAEYAAIYQREQRARLVPDPWTERVLTYARQHPEISIPKFLEDCSVPFHLQTPELSGRLLEVFGREGFTRGAADDGAEVWINPQALEAMKERGFVQ